MAEPGENRMVILDTFPNSILAGLAKAKLDAYGIPCMLTGETVSALYPFPAGGFSDIRLYVLKADVEQALAVLQESD